MGFLNVSICQFDLLCQTGKESVIGKLIGEYLSELKLEGTDPKISVICVIRLNPLFRHYAPQQFQSSTGR